MNLIILEDDHVVADLMAEGLQLAGYRVRGIATTVASAVTLARCTRPELAVVDIHLGEGGDGAGFAAALQADWSMGILFATGYGHETRLWHAGGLALIRKPYCMPDLLAALGIVRDILCTGGTAQPVPPGVRRLDGPPPPDAMPPETPGVTRRTQRRGNLWPLLD